MFRNVHKPFPDKKHTVCDHFPETVESFPKRANLVPKRTNHFQKRTKPCPKQTDDFLEFAIMVGAPTLCPSKIPPIEDAIDISICYHVLVSMLRQQTTGYRNLNKMGRPQDDHTQEQEPILKHTKQNLCRLCCSRQADQCDTNFYGVPPW